MGMFTMYWLRRFIRNNMPPVPEPKANVWNKRLSVAYALIAWNAFGFVLYSCYNGKAEWTEYHGLKTEEELKKTPGQQWVQTLGLKNAKVYRIAGLNVTEIKDNNEEETPNVNEEETTIDANQ